MEKYLLNLTDGRITREGNGFEFNYLTVVGEEQAVEGGFAFIGTDENGNKVEAFLSEEEYFNGKEFVAGTKAPRTLIVEGKALEVEARTMVVEEAIKTINAYLEEVGAVINKIEEDELRHELRDIENPLKWYVANLEEMVEAEAKEEEPKVVKVEGVVDLVAVGTKVIVVCLEGSKNFTKRMSYKGTVHGMNGHYRLKGDNGKYYIVKASRFTVRDMAENKPSPTNREKVEELAKAEGLVVGCWDKELDSFTEASIKHIINRIDIGSATDIIVRNNMKDYVVSVDFVEGEIDFTVWTKEEYVRLFGLGKFLDY